MRWYGEKIRKKMPFGLSGHAPDHFLCIKLLLLAVLMMRSL